MNRYWRRNLSNTDIIRSLQSAMEAKQTPAPYDAPAVVTRIEGGATAWVKIAGSDTETPVKLTIDAKTGDTVQVRVGGGSAWLTGNQTAPPTDDTKADKAMEQAKQAGGVATNYVTDTKDGIFVHPKNNDANGVRVQNTVQIVRGGEAVSEYGEKVRLGKNGQTNMQIAPDSMDMTAPDGSTALRVQFELETLVHDLTAWGVIITNEHGESFIRVTPAPNSDATAYTNKLSYWARMHEYAWGFDTSRQMMRYDQTDGFTIDNSNGISQFCVAPDGTVTVANSAPIVYEDKTTSISFAAGTVGTRGASVALGSASKSGYVYLGAYVIDHQNTSHFWCDVGRNASTGNTVLSVYRATAQAVSGDSVTIRKMWAKSQAVGT